MSNKQFRKRMSNELRIVTHAAKNSIRLLKYWNHWGDDNPNRKSFPRTTLDTVRRSIRIAKAVKYNIPFKIADPKRIYEK